MTEKNTKGWLVRTPTQELFDEVRTFSSGDTNTVFSDDWLNYRGGTYLRYDHEEDWLCFGSVDSSYNVYDRYKDTEITIEQFREMYGKKEETVEQVKPAYDQYAQVGDITSDKKGSGARYNNGKPNYSLVVLSQLSQVLSNRSYNLEHAYLFDVLNNLAVFQETQDVSCLYEALNELGMDAIEESTHVFTYGKMKYAAFNWAKGANWSIPLACAVRHLLKILRDGEEVDEESGRKHVGHIVCNLMMLIHYTKYYKEGNDLPPTWMFQEGSHEPN